jgi:APA family basic amino acid/polyamine antiporter
MSSGKASISPIVGVLICLNTMIGAGLFINPKLLVLGAGKWGFAGYAISGLLILPLVLCVSTLAKLHPVSGGLYVFSRQHIGRWAGFLSGWSYFLGKAVVAGLLMHKFVQFFQSQFICLNGIPTLGLDYLVLISLIVVHILGASIGGKIQYLFVCLKMIPVFFVFVLGFTSFDLSFYQLDTTSFYNLFTIIPICVFAFTGFEIICSVGHMVEDPTKNIKRVILIAFGIVTCVNILFQFLIFGALGNSLADANVPILLLANKSIPAYIFIGKLLNGFVYAAILGGCFSIITANCWNLFTLAENNHIPFKKLFTKVSAGHVPWVALIVEGLIVAIAIAITKGDQAPLQTLAVFSQLIALILSAFAAYFAAKRVKDFGLARWIPLLGICTAFYILSISTFNIIKYGISGSFLAIFSVGILAAITKKSIRD